MDKLRRNYEPGLARFSGEERTKRALLTAGQQVPVKPSRLAHGEDQENTEIVIPQTRQQEPAPQTLAAVPDTTPEKPPGDGDRLDGSGNAAAVEAAARVRTAEKISIAAASVVDPPPVESVTPPAQVSDTTQDESEINGLGAGQNNVAMAASDRVLPDFESMDVPAAGDGTDRMARPKTIQSHPRPQGKKKSPRCSHRGSNP